MSGWGGSAGGVVPHVLGRSEGMANSAGGSYADRLWRHRETREVRPLLSSGPCSQVIVWCEPPRKSSRSPQNASSCRSSKQSHARMVSQISRCDAVSNAVFASEATSMSSVRSPIVGLPESCQVFVQRHCVALLDASYPAGSSPHCCWASHGSTQLANNSVVSDAGKRMTDKRREGLVRQRKFTASWTTSGA